MRGAPQSGFASRIWRINARKRDASAGRPMRRGREFQRQEVANARRCQRTTVDGVMICTARRQSGQTLESSTQSSRSIRRRRGRFGGPVAARRVDAGERGFPPRPRAESGSWPEARPARRRTAQSCCPRTVSVSGSQSQRAQQVPNIQYGQQVTEYYEPGTPMVRMTVSD
jgi:hypothetical protein